MWTKPAEGVDDVEEDPVTLVARTEFPTKATHAQTRAHNASLVLRALYDLGPISRAEIARLTGLTRTSVGELVARARAGGPRPGGRPRPAAPAARQPTLVSLVDDARHVVTLDLGERTFTAALLDLRGEVRERVSTRPRRRGRRRRPRPRPRPDRRDPGRPAPADPRHRRRHPGHRRRRRHDPLGRQPRPGPTCRSARLLAAHYDLPTVVANDSRAAALATFLFGGDERPDNLVAIKVGRGIGAGLVLDGELFGGDGDGAGEIGHVVVEPDGAECHCGRFGCLETVASAPAILRAAARRGPQRRRHSPSWPPRPRPATRPRWPSRAPPAGPSARRSRT